MSGYCAGADVLVHDVGFALQHAVQRLTKFDVVFQAVAEVELVVEGARMLGADLLDRGFPGVGLRRPVRAQVPELFFDVLGDVVGRRLFDEALDLAAFQCWPTRPAS